MAEATSTETANTGGRAIQYLRSVIWIWIGAATNLIVGIFLTPYIIRKIGPAGYGVWAAVFSLVGYYGFLDFGFRPAVIRFCAHYRATQEHEKINEILNTMLLYYTLGSSILVVIASVVVANSARIFPNITPDFRGDFSFLIMLTAVSWLFGVNLFSGAMEGFQRFETSSHIYIACQVFRTAGAVILLAMGYKLVALGLNLLATQILGTTLAFFGLRSAFPQFRLARKYIRVSALKELVAYGSHSFVGNMAYSFLDQSAALIIAMFRAPEFVGFYSLPNRLLMYAGDIICRGAAVTATSTADLGAKGEMKKVANLGIYANRYAFVLFMPLSLFLLVYGNELLKVYVGPLYVQWSGPLIPLFVISVSFAIAGQYNSTNVLYGLAKHKKYAWGLVTEAALFCAGLWFITPRYGILGAAWVSAILMIANRGIYTAWLVCESVGMSFLFYMKEIYLRATLLAVVVAAAGWGLKAYVLPGRNLPQLIAAGVLISILFMSGALFLCVEPHHRDLLLGKLLRRFRGAPVVAA